MKQTFNFICIFLCGLFFLLSCNIESANQDNLTRTNIRFASIGNGYNELNFADRLSTAKTEITSKVFQMEGPAWENENVAFRNYFDSRNGIDIFGKRTNRMILDSVGIDEDYHKLQDWGMDILKVGNSLGAGAIGLILEDSLFRVGASGGSYEMIAEKTDHSAIQFSFDDCKIRDRKYKILHKIEIFSGTHFYKSSISIEGLKGDEILVSGIVAHTDSVLVKRADDFSIICTHGSQAIGGQKLGLALAIPNAQFRKTSKATDYLGEIDNTHLVELKLVNGEARFFFFSGWELQDAGFGQKQYFLNTIDSELKHYE